MKYHGLTSSSEEERVKTNQEKPGFSLASQSINPNASAQESNASLINHINWQESELKRLKALILLTCINQFGNVSTTGTAGSK